MAVIGFALFLKIVLGAIYNVGYRCSHKIATNEYTTVNDGRARRGSKV
jgi:hypothetical protein